MADRLSDRFRNLERARRPGEVDPVHQADGRIGAIEPEAPGRPRAAPAPAPANLERFRPPAEPSLDTARSDDAAAAAGRAKREVSGELARRVGELERRRPEGEYGRWGGPGSRYDEWGDPAPDRTPYGVRMLRLIKSPAWRIGVAVALVAVPLLLILFAHGNGGARLAGFVAVILLAALFSPPGYRYRRRGFWGW